MILPNVDKGHASWLLFLDLPAAFDIVDHASFGGSLEAEVGIGGWDLDWFKLFLTDQT